MNCPFLNEHCLGPKCGNFNDPDSKFGKKDFPRGCKGDNPTAEWARWYLNTFSNEHTNGDYAK